MSKCEKCGKTDFDDADGCLDAGTYSPAVGDWTCCAGAKNLEVKFAWQSPETAPKDRTFIADFGYPWATVATYSPATEQFAAADLEASMYEGKNDLYFVTEWHDLSELKGWLEMPGIPRGDKA